jgi:3-deoxy-D-manno-octulosonic-acid transferase
MTDASAQGWARTPASAHALLGAFDLVLPQDKATEDRLRKLGAHTGLKLNLKLVGAPPPVDQGLAAALSAGIAGRKVVLAASTHLGEEALIAQAARTAAPDALLVVAPRHPERGPQVAADLKDLGFKVARRAAHEPLTAGATAYVADTLGEMGALFTVADVVVMGGSFVEGIGGHNPLEPARLGRAIVTGPHTFNATDVYAQMFAEAAAIEAKDPGALIRHIRGLLTYPMIARRTGEAALAFANRQGAALEAALKLLEPLLPT